MSNAIFTLGPRKFVVGENKDVAKKQSGNAIATSVIKRKTPPTPTQISVQTVWKS